MGDRTISFRTCPTCQKIYEVYDAPSSLLYSAWCNNCGYNEGLDYYETGPNEISLLTKKEAKKRGLLDIKYCKDCGRTISKSAKRCHSCANKKRHNRK
jgi:hypothetical protein